ncbi:MAG: family 10 glycosylhydrolase [Deltaproteobacteria bacterium]|nr:family 10 glycosylhydrolase [Deltaproteobacteria bacterium]MBW2447153.1 family 10 glycosylhydrolase [Deltaproteobacteria bacterium]
MPPDPTTPMPRPARALLAGLLTLVLCAGSTRADPRPPPEVKRPLGLWVLAEGSQRVLENPERIPALLRDARALGATDLFVQVVRRGVTWWPSTVARPAETWAAARAAAPDTPDPLARLLADAHDEGLKVHAWVNLLSLGSNAEAPILAALGTGVLQVDRKGRSILDYPDRRVPEPDSAFLQMGTPALWVDPAAPGVAAWQRELVAELFSLYPSLDGLHLDHVRYPDVLPFTPGSRFAVGLDFGYGEATRARFAAATNLSAPLGSETTNAEAWDAWRRAELTELVAGLRETMRGVAPGAALSAAVFAWQNRAYLSLYQDWFGWLEAGLLEFAVPMLYTRDPRLLRYQAAAFAGGVAHERIWTGLGSWLFRAQPEGAVAQLREVDRLGVAGRAFFSWDSIAEAPALRAALVEEAKRAARP